MLMMKFIPNVCLQVLTADMEQPRVFFAVESAMDELAAQMGMNPIELRKKNMVRQGQVMPAYYGETANSCALDRCVDKVMEMIGWDRKISEKRYGKWKGKGSWSCNGYAGLRNFRRRRGKRYH